jgi:hypothetical protein
MGPNASGLRPRLLVPPLLGNTFPWSRRSRPSRFSPHSPKHSPCKVKTAPLVISYTQPEASGTVHVT